MKAFIKNRDGNEICVLVENINDNDKLVFAMHGLSSYKEQQHFRTIVEAFLENDYTVVTFDVVHTFGESRGGKYEDATTTNYYADLEDVVSWAAGQEWYREPFAMTGHSMGGFCTAYYAQNHPAKVKAIAPISTVVSGQLLYEAHDKEKLKKWQNDGVVVYMSHDGKREKRLKWGYMEDAFKYDLLDKVERLTMPVLLIVGENDDGTPPEHQKILFDKLHGQKELHVIKGALHSFYEPHEQAELKQLIKTWVKRWS
jgi:pimeloyl-ACP methyl ester carboxylesterase